MTFYRDMAKKYGLTLYKSECESVPGAVVYEDDYQTAVKDVSSDGVKTSVITA